MGTTGNHDQRDRTEYAFNITLAAVAGQVGCLTLVIVLAALFGGLWLDNYFQTKPMFTIVLMVASIPVTLVLMFWVVRAATSRLQKNSNQAVENKEEEEPQGD